MKSESSTQLRAIMTDNGNRYKSINRILSGKTIGNKVEDTTIAIVTDSNTREEVKQFRKKHYRHIFPEMDLDNDLLDDYALILCTRNTKGGVESTARLSLDNPIGFPQERYLEGYRARGGRLIELGRFIIDEGNLSLLKGYYRSFYVLARCLQCDAIVMSMQPRHLRFHQRLVGLRILAENTEDYGGPHSLACVVWEIKATLPKFFKWLGGKL